MFFQAVTNCIRSQMEWSDHKSMRDIISFLATQEWEKIMEEEVSMEFVDRLVATFSIPLEDAQADVSKIRDEF